MSASTLKIIALVTMILDHIGGALFPQCISLRIIGRIAFPIYAFFIAQGCVYTKNAPKYLCRLFIFALISEIPYDICFNSYSFPVFSININFFNNTNTIYTLFLGAMLIFVLKIIEKNKISIPTKILISIFCIGATFFVSETLKTDYGMWGIMLILTFYFTRNNKLLTILIPLALIYYKYINYLYLPMFLFNIIPLGLLYFYNNKKGISLKWIFYIGYPLHLIIIAIIKIATSFYKYYWVINKKMI